MMKILKNEFFWLSLIIAFAFWVRLYKINNPIADWHSWRQADTAAVTRNFIKEGFNPFYPKYDDMSGVAQDPIPNPGRFRFVEFPIYNIFVYPFYLIFGIHEVYHRLVSVLFSLGSIIFLYLITKKYTDKFSAFLSSLVFALLPYNIYFSRVTLPEPTLVFFSLGTIYFIDKWIDSGKRNLILLGILFGITALLIKPWVLFFCLPLLYSAIKKEHKLFLPKKYLLVFILIVLPFLFWRLWILSHPEGIPASNWLLNGDGIRFRPAFWWWIVSERIGREILGVTGAFLFFLGLIIKPKLGNFFLHFFALSGFLYIIVVATGNVRHDYYQTIFIPIVAIFTGRGLAFLLKGSDSLIPRIWTISLGLLFVPLTLYFCWTQIKGLYQINNPAIIEAGQEADRILPKNAIVVAPYNGDTAFLYQTNRPGWPVTAFPLKELVSGYGVTSYISTAKDAKTKWVMRHFIVLKDTPNYVIADLTKMIKPFSTDDPEP